MFMVCGDGMTVLSGVCLFFVKVLAQVFNEHYFFA